MSSSTSGERCENCLRLRQEAVPQFNLPAITLKRCGACKGSLYCVSLPSPRLSRCSSNAMQSKECQKAHRKVHRQFCVAQVAINKASEASGEVVQERYKAFGKWCSKYAQAFSRAGIHALDLQKDFKFTGTLFLPYLSFIIQD